MFFRFSVLSAASASSSTTATSTATTSAAATTIAAAGLIITAGSFVALLPGLVAAVKLLGLLLPRFLLLGLSRTAAARFSFLLSIPTIAGAALLTGIDLAQQPQPARWLDLLLGASLAGISAYLCISAFIALVERTGMLPYVIYRLLLGIALLWLVA